MNKPNKCFPSGLLTVERLVFAVVILLFRTFCFSCCSRTFITDGWICTFASLWHEGLYLVCNKLPRILLTQGHYLLQAIKVITLRRTVVFYVPCY